LISQADGRLVAREADMMWDRSIRTVEWLMNEVSLLRLYILRAAYLFIVVGLGVCLWPGVLKLDKHYARSGFGGGCAPEAPDGGRAYPRGEQGEGRRREPDVL
jgi:hypothetical protein